MMPLQAPRIRQQWRVDMEGFSDGFAGRADRSLLFPAWLQSVYTLGYEAGVAAKAHPPTYDGIPF